MQQPASRWRSRGPLPGRRPGALEFHPPPIAHAGESNRIVRVADLELDPDWHAVSRHGRPITLTRIQFQLLMLLAEHVNDVVGYEQLVAEVWGHTGEESPSSLVKSHISRLRHKLGLGPLGPLTVKAWPGQGYMLRLRPVT